MGTLYIDKKGLCLKKEGRTLAFYLNGRKEGHVPVGPLKRIIIIGNALIESSVLSYLARLNITVIFLSGRIMRFGGRLQGNIHHHGILRRKQYEKSLSNFSLEMGRSLIKRKIMKQRDLLEEIKEQRPDKKYELAKGSEILSNIVENITDSADFESLRGFEGGAAAAFYAAFCSVFPPSLEFNSRNRRPPLDPVNSVLSLGYTLLHFEMVREIEMIGLDPTIGFFHQFEYGRESLACDLIEPYRPEVERFAYNIFHEREFVLRDFVIEKNFGCYLKKNRRKTFYHLYEDWAREIRPQLRTETRELSRRIMDGQDVVFE